MTAKEFIDSLETPAAARMLASLYGEDAVKAAKTRCRRLAEELLDAQFFPPDEYPEAAGDLRLFSVPGRTELGGNHTDHNCGKVLAASVHLDAVAFAAPRNDNHVFFRSHGHRDIKLDLSDLSVREEEKGDTEALIRGIAAEMTAQGTPVRGFTANAANAVLSGSGLSSSAAVEVLFAKIFDSLYCGGKRSAVELAKIGQKAENVYFGKPCGLMDQIACASGGAVAIDFADEQKPLVKGVTFDPCAAGFALCVVNTGGRHSDLISDYAAIPFEMKAAAAVFGKTVLAEVDEENFLSRIADVREAAGDRAVLRALHFFSENRRVDEMLAALENLHTQPAALETFLALVRDSGASSAELLQNIHSPENTREQGVGIALALSKRFFSGGRPGVSRVHGGGFAGTIQTYLPLERLDEYRALMEGVFGNKAVTVLRIRQSGAAELRF